MNDISEMIPTFGLILKASGISLSSVKSPVIEQKLSSISDLACNYQDLPDQVIFLIK